MRLILLLVLLAHVFLKATSMAGQPGGSSFWGQHAPDGPTTSPQEEVEAEADVPRDFVRQVEDFFESNRTLPLPYPTTPRDQYYLKLALEVDSKRNEMTFKKKELALSLSSLKDKELASSSLLKDKELVYRRRTLLYAVSIGSAAVYFGLTGGVSVSADKICTTLEKFFSGLSTCVLLTGFGKGTQKQRDALEKSDALTDCPPAARVSGLKTSRWRWRRSAPPRPSCTDAPSRAPH